MVATLLLRGGVSREEMDRHKAPQQTHWAKAVNAFLEAADLYQTELADKIGEKKSYVNRFLTGHRRPAPETVKKISEAVAELTGRPHLKPHLKSEAFISGLVSADGAATDAIRHTLGDVLNLYARMFRTGYLERIVQFVQSQSDPADALAKMLADLTIANRRVIIAELRGSSGEGFSLIRAALQRHGVQVEQLLTDKPEELLAFEWFRGIVRGELANTNQVSSRDRADAEDRIISALQQHFQLIYKPHSISNLIITAPSKKRQKRSHS
jgi:transcriptional regulator with XRE-family HTH domain